MPRSSKAVQSFTSIDSCWSWYTSWNSMQFTIRCAFATDSLVEKWFAINTRFNSISNWWRKRCDYTCINDGMIDLMLLMLIRIIFFSHFVSALKTFLILLISRTNHLYNFFFSFEIQMNCASACMQNQIFQVQTWINIFSLQFT